MDVQVMCALVANDPAKQTWLRSAGLLQVLHRLTLGAQSDGQDVNNDVSSALGEHVSLSVRRQCARILAILAHPQDALVRSDVIIVYLCGVRHIYGARCGTLIINTFKS